jgi:DNA invertase Pin-like site-specific DNA recombinase
MKAAIYARVSTKDKGQDVENQLAQLRRYASERAWECVEYVDHETGKTSAGRAQLQAMFAAASRREFNVVLIWALDRLSREGVSKTFEHIKMLRGYGVEIESYTEHYFRTTGPVGELVIAIFAWIAEQERIRISERTKAGLATARAKGKTLGRPWSVIPRGRIYEDRKRGLSWSALEKKYGICQSSIRNAVKRVETFERARKPIKRPLQQSPSKPGRKFIKTKTR